MGCTPINVYVPPSNIWTEKAPEWAKYKREMIIDVIRLAIKPGRIIEDETAGLQEGQTSIPIYASALKG